MTAIEVFSELMRLGCDACLEGDSIRVVPPHGVTLPDSLKEEIRQNKVGLFILLRKLEIETVKRRLLDQGWVLIHSAVLNEAILWVWDDNTPIPAHLSGLPRYTLAELKALLAEPVPNSDDLKLLHRSKVLFGGTFMEATHVGLANKETEEGPAPVRLR